MQWLLCLRTARWSKKQWSCKPEIVGRRIIQDPGEVEDGFDDWMTASERAPQATLLSGEERFKLPALVYSLQRPFLNRSETDFS
jgi:hypothetical protein